MDRNTQPVFLSRNGINGQGKVESFTFVETRGHPSLAVETAKVLPRWRFPPPRISGQKVRIQSDTG
ncbi:MAG: energy transducer TonB [Chitinispirillaceae bacterium]|nr:energy transducer TonB [Chitinispirillaceae bacterium]